MAYLILDLDETVMQARGSRAFVHPCHISLKRFTWREWITSCEGDYKLSQRIDVEIVILNPDKLAQLISAAITKHDGIIILTSGLWSPAILEPIAEKLELESLIKQKFIKSLFFSPVIEEHYWERVRSVKDIRYQLTKNERLNKIINHPEHIQTLGQRYFVMLDNEQRHVDSFKENPRVTAIQATTDIKKDSFYVLTLEQLALMSLKEKNEGLAQTKEQGHIPPSPHVRYSLFARLGCRVSGLTKSERSTEVESSVSDSEHQTRQEPLRFKNLGQRVL